MRHTFWFLLWFAVPSAAAFPQAVDPAAVIVGAVEVSGIDRDRLSPGLRGAIDELPGMPYDADVAAGLAGRIEEEQPEYVAAVRTAPLGAGDRVEVIFLVARISDDPDLESNINARYTVEGVEVSGVPPADVGDDLHARMDAMVGERLDPDTADAIEEDLAAEFPRYTVRWRIERGSERGQIRVVFEFSRIPWIPYRPSRSLVSYHSKQGFSGVIETGMGRNNQQIRLGLALWSDEDLIEEYAGFSVGYENRLAGTERLGFGIEFSRYRQKWRRPTLDLLAASPAIPDAYRVRQTIEPTITFAFSPSLRIRTGVAVTDLESYADSPRSESSAAVVGGIEFDRSWESGPNTEHDFRVSYLVRSGTRTLESDLVYARHFGEVLYEYRRDHSAVASEFFAGRITGPAPLYERFSIGNASTLRGWNKFDIAPVGGDHVVHHTLEYRYRGFAVFQDTGAIWNDGEDPRVRLSAGFGYHSRSRMPGLGNGDDNEDVSVFIAFPIRSERVKPMFMLKVRF